ncbi:MAG: gamma-glutamyl-gamma-aminobutyrate hydrolase family protein [Candidatus Sulfotelmatobacter sp.]|jgi:putative glutamine amidotransferase
MPPRIAIPMPHSADRDYAERAIPQYEQAVQQAGGVPVRIPLDQTPAQVMRLIERCDGVLLPGSNADVDPAKFGAPRSPHTAAADPRRDTVDELLLQDAYNMRKPVLGICYGLQSLNVYRTGSLIQHIPDFLPEELRARVDHEAGKKVAVAHSVKIEQDSKLAAIVAEEGNEERAGIQECGDSRPRLSNRSQLEGLSGEGKLLFPVNSSHHQSAGTVGDGLRISACCAEDGIIEALEGTSPDHFVLAVQWHPERSVAQDEASRAIFRALVEAAEVRHKQLADEFEGVK